MSTPTRRERVRQTAINEIKSIAWETANTNGIEQVTINGIAQQMGMTPPAFYSYFKNRDELLRTLVIDAYRSYRESLIAARDAVADTDPAGQLFSVFMTYRQWAIDNPGMFGLFAGRRVHGFRQRDPDIIAEAEKSNKLFIHLYEAAWQQGLIRNEPEDFDPPQLYAKAIRQATERYNVSFPAVLQNHILMMVMAVHGIISMELSDRFSSLVGDFEAFYRFQVIRLLKRMGLHVDSDL